MNNPPQQKAALVKWTNPNKTRAKDKFRIGVKPEKNIFNKFNIYLCIKKDIIILLLEVGLELRPLTISIPKTM